MIDFASRIVANCGNNSLSKVLSETWNGNFDVVREKLESKALFLRDVELLTENIEGIAAFEGID
jgi:hypothetical protein